LEALSERIAQRLSVSSVSNDSVTLVHQTATRCRASLDRALEALVAASNAARINAGDEFVAAELRLALDSLATIIGEVHSDDILGEIFSKFCIGK
jgi:tRNA modification GTPase